jgi:hypothetical protein
MMDLASVDRHCREAVELMATILAMSDQEAIEGAAHIVLLARALHSERCTG